MIPWTGILEANNSVKCPQRGIGNEDCLVVNVFTPVTIKEMLPVLVFFHGGSYILGSGYTKGFTPLINHNIIVVTVNYRLGALGFLCLGTEDAPGNAGMKDQVAALNWVQGNIANFGGDPNKVTIYGMSAGAASVEILVLSDLSKGLFKQAIVESTSATSVFATAIDPIADAQTLSTALQFPKTSDLAELASYYQNVPSDTLSAVNYEYYMNLTDGTFGFVPCVEKQLENIDPFITNSPLNILREASYASVPIMFSYATAEGLFLKSEEFYAEDYKERMNANFANFLPGDLVFDSNEIKHHVAENTKRFYFRNNTILEDHLLDYLNYLGDFYVLYPTMNSLKYHLRNSNNPVYLFEFAFKGNMGSEDEFYKDIKIAGHGDIVKHAILIKPIVSELDRIAVERVSSIIANFMKYG